MEFRTVLIGAVSALALEFAPAWAASDHDRARAALQAGEIRPLAEVLQAVERDVKGNVIEIELEREDGRWIYEVKVLTGSGAVLHLDYDAQSATQLRQRSSDSESGRRR